MEAEQWMQYVPVLMLLGVAGAIVGGMMVAGHLLGKRGKRTPVKDSPYECGAIPIDDHIPPMAIRFYLVAMLFILFDVEVAFLYPYAVIYKESMNIDPNTTLIALLSFMAILFVGFIYALKKKALQFIR
jgi:NADH-quinone oxidoreductase subunit A